MAKEVVGSITSAVTSAVADKAVSKLVDSLGKQTPVADKLQRLERLCMRVRSTVEVSEKHDIESASLLQWREELREAVALGDEVLLSFQQPTDAAQGGGGGGTSAGTGSTALSFTKQALWSMARRISDTAASLFSNDEDAKKLERAVEVLEKASENMGEFIGLLQLEASPRLKRRRRGPFSMLSFRRQKEVGSASGAASGSIFPRTLRKSQEVAVLVGRLQKALFHILVAVDKAEYRGVKEMELGRLAQWVVFLREAVQIGYTVLHGLILEDGEENPEYAHEEDQLRSFVHAIESIAGDSEFFTRLITKFCHFSD
ncbi:unnamed protein product [Urochloa humidicola]